jgi:hypothetical protein
MQQTEIADPAGMDMTEIMKEIAELAPRKDHHLAKDMVNGSRPLARQAAEMVLKNLRRCPDRAGLPEAEPEASKKEGVLDWIPVGYYATPSRTGSNDIDFWKVEREDSGKWAGFTFAKRVLGGGTEGQTRLTRVHMSEQRSALAAIARHGIEESRMLYAVSMKRCTRCNRDLSDDLSRERGMGDYCWNKKQGDLWRSTLGPGPPSRWRSWPFGLRRPARTPCSSRSAGAGRWRGCGTGWRARPETARRSATLPTSWRR